MQFRQLGNSGLEVSLIGLGGNNFGARMSTEDARPIVHKALDLGITLFDTADSYGAGGSEEALGAILGDRRKDIVLTSKVGLSLEATPRRVMHVTRDYIIKSVEDSLRRLKTDWIDLYQLHALHRDGDMEEILRAMSDLIQQGKVRHVGCCNLPAWQVVDADWMARELGLTRFVSSQNEYSVLNREVEKELLPALRAKSIGMLPFYPLAAGVLTGKYRKGGEIPAGTRLAKVPTMASRYFTDDNMDVVEALRGFAESRGRTLLELSFAWLTNRAEVSCVIAGASRPEQVETNVGALGWSLSEDEAAEIDQLSTRDSDIRFSSIFRS